MFRIDRTLVNLSTANIVQANTDDSARDTRQPSGVSGEPHESKAESAPGQDERPAKPERPTAAQLELKKAEEALARAKAEAAEIVKKAQRQAHEAIEEARAKADGIRADAYREGYERGERDGNEVAAQALGQKMKEDDEALRLVIEEIAEARSRALAEIEDEVIELTLSIAKKIINFASENDDTVFESMINNALKQMNVGGKLAIRVGIREYDRFFSSGSAVFTLSDGTSVTAAMTRDPLLGELDCIIDTEEGTVNAGLDSQLKYIELAFGEADTL